MSRTFAQLKTNVGNDIQDTSTTMATLIGRYLNRRYLQALRAINFTYVNDDYALAASTGIANMTLPSDFKTEMYAVDTTNNVPLERVEFQNLYRDFYDSLTTQGQVYRYVIFTDDSNIKKIKLHYIPSANCTIALPYIATPTEMSADGAVPILGMEDMIELGATADAWRYKRQFAKATNLDIQYNQMFADFVFAQENNPNDKHQFVPDTLSRDSIY